MNGAKNVMDRAGWVLGSSMVVGIAALTVVISRMTHPSEIVPIVFLLLIIGCARFFGWIAGALGSIVATVLFAFYLYEPYGSWHVHNEQAMTNLALLFFAGIALSYANAKSNDQRGGVAPRLKQR